MRRLEDELREMPEERWVNLVYDGRMIKNYAGTLLCLLSDKVLQGIVKMIGWESGVLDVTIEVTPREENDQDEYINETIIRLECCATPGGCYSCPEAMNTNGCDRTTMREAARLLRELEADRARLIHALSRVDIDCAYCAHKDRHAKECVAADTECDRCGVAECQCRECNGGKHWTWGGGGDE